MDVLQSFVVPNRQHMTIIVIWIKIQELLHQGMLNHCNRNGHHRVYRC